MKVWRYLPPFIKRSRPSGEDHSAILETIRKVIDEASTFVSDLISRGIFQRATGEILDLWGKTFGVGRYYGEGDDQYQERIHLEVTMPRLTKDTLKRIIATSSPNVTVDEINIFEPFTELYPLNDGFILNGTRIPDYTYWTWAVIDIQTPRAIPPQAKAKAEEFKAFGVKLHYTTSNQITIADQVWQATITSEGQTITTITQRIGGEYILSGATGLLNGGGQVL